MKIKTAIIPVAGLGTRFLPLTKTLPKEMTPILSTPTIEYIVEEAINSGIEEIIFITSSSKTTLVNYFDRNFELENHLLSKKKTEALKKIKKFVNSAQFVHIRQHKALGLGHAISQAKRLIQDDYFAILLGDDVVYNKEKPALAQLIEISKKYNSSVLGIGEVPSELVSNYGVIDIKKELEPNVWELKGVVEKPKKEDAPSNYSIMGRYILSSKIFDFLEKGNIDKNTGEIQITDSILDLLNKEKVLAYKFTGKRYDLGSIKGFLQANIEYSLRDPALKNDVLDILKENIKKYN